jgi:ABC-type antimicrobial peptide transport system permease subunit
MVRRFGTVMTAFGIGLNVAIIVVMLAMVNGLDATLVETGEANNLICIREGSLNEVNSYFNRDKYDLIRFLPGVARDENNESTAVGEIVVGINRERKDGESANLILRGTSRQGFKLRPEFRIVQGRMFENGLRELIVSRSVAERFSDLGIGDEVEMHSNTWPVVGLFETNGGAYDSEIWGSYEDISQVWQRPVYSSVLLRLDSRDRADELIRRISDDERIQLNAVPQDEYFAEQTFSSIGLKALIFFIAVVMGTGSCFAIMNMMYGSVMSRQQEVAALRAIGFRRISLLGSFLTESAFLALLGGIIGCVLGSLFHGYSAGTSNFASFSEIVFHFRITPEIVVQGLIYALALGILGGLLPARRAASVQLIDVLRE